MELPHREKIVTTLISHAGKIKRSNNINEMIMIHEMMISSFYAKKPLFYKILFKSIRLYTTSIILTLYYYESTPTLKKVKEFITCEKNSLCINTINSFFMQLRVSGRLDIYRNENNRRENLYRPSPSAIQEIFDLLQCLLKPYQIFNNEACCLYESCPDEFVRHFFSRYADFMFNHITIPQLLPATDIFINKDGGYMIMLILYKEYVLQNSQCIMLPHKKIAEYSHVSRSHVCSLLREAQTAGLLSVENNLFIRLSETFLQLFRDYYSLYMAGILYCTAAHFPELERLP